MVKDIEEMTYMKNSHQVIKRLLKGLYLYIRNSSSLTGKLMYVGKEKLR